MTEWNTIQSTAILTEGADIPNVDCIVICRPTRSRNVYAQMVRSKCLLFYIDF